MRETPKSRSHNDGAEAHPDQRGEVRRDNEPPCCAIVRNETSLVFPNLALPGNQHTHHIVCSNETPPPGCVVCWMQEWWDGYKNTSSDFTEE